MQNSSSALHPARPFPLSSGEEKNANRTRAAKASKNATRGKDWFAGTLVLTAVGIVMIAAYGFVQFSWFLLWYLAMSLITFAVYGEDKRKARQQRRRISERVLHRLELCGGWPGALLGQWYFHHKIRKTAYRRVTFSVATAHIAVWLLVWSW